MKKTKGFTLVELVIVIIIVGILSIVAVPIYRGYTRKAMATEGKALLGSIVTAEKVYYTEFTDFLTVAETAFSSELDVDARSNKYFTSFQIGDDSGSGTDRYSALVKGFDQATGINITVQAGRTGQPVFTVTGLNVQ